MDKAMAYELGYDCGKNEPNTTNCHFSIFNSLENTESWEQGKQDAKTKTKEHITIGKYTLSSYADKSILISKEDGEAAEYSIKELEERINTFWKEKF
ncbi:hypothetical protein LCGC14_1081240 [marine sediment metagenome]|uniref:Uncharacterized protein n=1 Tax=marine sediment metagenome TaxID=412755 RepID=A0A0F9PYC5_9ZZZZ